MKKLIAIALIVVALAAAWFAGRQSGIHHAITRSEIWTDTPGLIYLDLDGQTYIHTLN